MYVCACVCVRAYTGEHSSDLFILIRGDVYVMDDRDSQTKLVKVPEGSIFGEEGVISHLNVSMTCVCVCVCVFYFCTPA